MRAIHFGLLVRKRSRVARDDRYRDVVMTGM